MLFIALIYHRIYFCDGEELFIFIILIFFFFRCLPFLKLRLYNLYYVNLPCGNVNLRDFK